MFKEPRYRQPEIVAATGATPPMLQNWVNRGHVVLDEPSPGRGKSRLYSANDAAKVAIMAALAGFSIPVTAAKDFAEDFARLAAEEGKLDWDLCATLTAETLRNAENTFSAPPFYRWNPQPRSTAAHVIANPLSLDARRLRRDVDVEDYGPVTDAERRELARRGVEEQPALFIPVGSIVNAALTKLGALE